jgi:hypothetical protein
MGPAYRIIEVLPNLLTPDSNRPLLIAGFWLVCRQPGNYPAARQSEVRSEFRENGVSGNLHA